MRSLALTAFAAIFTATSAMADPIHGLWQTIADDNGKYGHIEIKTCDGTICGFLRKSFDTNGKAEETANKNKASATISTDILILLRE